MNKIFRYTNYQSNPYGNGADKRTAQISELLNSNEFKWQIIPSGFNQRSFSFYYLLKCIKAIAYFIQTLFIIRRVCHPLLMYRTILLITHLKGVFSIPKAEKNRIILWESTKMDFSFVVPLFRKKGYSIIAIPHNIESLVPFQRSAITNRISPNWLMEEIRILKKCSNVFAISKEETLFLKQCGVKAQYLPYYPPNEIVNNLLLIRENRGKRERFYNNRKQILLLGSADNPPTKAGMENRINFFNQPENNICDIIVAGYGTELFINKINGKCNIKFFGELTNELLSEILCEIDAILIHQPATSGALTRIIESLVAGIPIIANFESARNYYGTDGVHVYNNDEQLIDYLSKDLSTPLIPDKPVIEYEEFFKIVNNSTI